MTLVDCETETILSDSERAIGTATSNFTMDKHDTLYVMQTQTTIANGLTITSSDWSNADESIDSDRESATNNLTITSIKNHVVDFGSDATRTVTVKTGGKAVSGNNTITWDYELSDDNISYDAPVTFLTKSYNTTEAFNTINLGSLSSFRYIRFSAVRTGGNAATNLKFYEVWEPSVSAGNSTLQFQILNDLTSNWSTLSSAGAITQAVTGSTPTTKLTTLTTLPNCPSGKLRVQITVVTGKCKDSVFVIKDGKQA